VLERDPALLRVPSLEPGSGGLPSPDPSYESLVQRVRRTVRQAVPPDATVLVVSKGDPDLVRLNGPLGRHFPASEDGGYAGFYPRDGADAVAQLEQAIERGAEFIVFPATSSWWLDEYPELSELLEPGLFRREDDVCAVYDLRSLPTAHGREVVRRRAAGGGPEISVVVPTRDRPDLLRECLLSLASQSVPPGMFEVVVVDDGSGVETESVCRSAPLPVRYVRSGEAGIATAKNAGASEATAPIVLFFDDDDVADVNLLRQHLHTHDAHPDEQVAVLGYTTWSPSLEVTEVMRFVTDVGHYLFAYDGLEDGQLLDFTYFWGGRASCKSALLTAHGGFRTEFEFGCEDIELAYRLSELGFRVVFNRGAVQYMNRPVTYDEFCRRCLRQGRAQWLFSQMHPDPVVQTYCGVGAAEERWSEIEPLLEGRSTDAHELEALLADSVDGAADELRKELWKLYWWSFDAFKVKGIVDAMRDSPATATAMAART